jgi:hypothetical protein
VAAELSEPSGPEGSPLCPTLSFLPGAHGRPVEVLYIFNFLTCSGAKTELGVIPILESCPRPGLFFSTQNPVRFRCWLGGLTWVSLGRLAGHFITLLMSALTVVALQIT